MNFGSSKGVHAAMLLTKSAKQKMRKDFATSLAKIPKESIENQSKSVIQRVIESPYYASAKRLSVYLSLPYSEINTDELVRHALESGRTIFIPFCKPVNEEMKMLRLSSLKEFQDLKTNKWNIREFESHGDREEALDGNEPLDLILVPGMAFDTSGARLGHGRGYYDRYLNRCSDHAKENNLRPPTSVALSLTEQILPPGYPVPTTVDDIKPDLIFHPQGEISKISSFGG